MRKITLITDYNDRFGTKYTAVPYRSGMNRGLLEKSFNNLGYDAVFTRASDIIEKAGKPAGQLFLYTSLEDRNEHYKSFIEDVVLALSLAGGTTIPEYRFLRAHNNKALMELMKKEWGEAVGDSLDSYVFGSLEELDKSDLSFSFPVVVKRPEGFKSRGVYLAGNMKELRRIASKISRTPFFSGEMKDRLRTIKYKGFKVESGHRRKFVIQNYIPGLQFDYKILVFGDKYYVLFRKTRKNDFRASGSGLLSYPADLPPGLLDFSEKVFKWFNVPQVSLDIAYDGSSYFILETQFIFFGTYTIEHAEFYFKKEAETWKMIKEKSLLEEEYVSSIHRYIEQNRL
jgi:hypothetical protein